MNSPSFLFLFYVKLDVDTGIIQSYFDLTQPMIQDYFEFCNMQDPRIVESWRVSATGVLGYAKLQGRQPKRYICATQK